MGWFSKKKNDTVKPAPPIRPAEPARHVPRQAQRQRQITEEEARRFARALSRFMKEKK